MQKPSESALPQEPTKCNVLGDSTPPSLTPLRDLLPPTTEEVKAALKHLYKIPGTSKRLAIQLKKGYAWNPLLTLPRNRPCPCLSGKKFKQCHLNLLPRIVLEKDAESFKKQMAKPDLVFKTQENEHLLKTTAEEMHGTDNDPPPDPPAAT